MDFRADILTILIFLPLVGSGLVLFAKSDRAARWTALAATGAAFALSLLLLVFFDWHAGEGYGYLRAGGGGVVQLVGQASWIKAFNIQYKVGLDGLSLPFVLLTTFIFVVAAIASWNIQRMTRGYFVLFLFLETGVLGVFLSLDFFLFYVFFEVSLLPMYFLIGIWGGPRRQYAAIKFFLYTLVGSIALLIVLIGTYLYTHSFDLVELPMLIRAKMGSGAGMISAGAARALFVLAMAAFLVKLPAVPLHTWLPDAHVEAPTPISMILAALLLKMGGYGIFRIAYPLFPDAGKTLWLLFAIIGVVSIIYGALCAMSQTDFKRLVAYSSVSHMGFVTLGAAVMTPAGMNGSLFMMISHGITSAAMFFIVGVVYDRAHHRDLTRMGGLAATMPLYTGFATIACFANLGLPGLCGFVGEVLVLLGSFQAARYDSVLVSGGYAGRGAIYVLSTIACFGLVLTAGYMLWTVQRLFLGPQRPEYRRFPEIDAREIGVLTPLTVMAVLLGVLPAVFVFSFSERTVAAIVRLFG
jgi:NADH-quinone oxidoreductase subunit M